MNSFSWQTALKIAWREARASGAKFTFVILAVAVGVGALTGVRSFSRGFERMLLKEARTLMAADLSVRVFSLPTPSQQEVMDSLASRRVARTWITETVSMVSRAGSDDPVLVSIKAVEPERYPFYGRLELTPQGDHRQLLGPDSVAVAEDLLIRLDAQVGDAVTVGGEDYRISAVVAVEPDRMAGSLNVGPRLMMSRAALDRTGLLQPGSRAAQRFLFRLGPGSPAVEKVRSELRAAFPDAQVADFTQTHPLITRGLERSTIFLSLVSLIALIVGALGVATAMHSHLQQKLDTIAIMKCLGARSGQIIRIYLLQTLLLGLAGAGLGLLFSFGVQMGFPILIQRYFTLTPEIGLDWISGLQGLLVGVLTTLLFTLPTLLSIRQVKPALIFRREMAETRQSWRERWKQSRAAAFSAIAILAGIAALAAWLSESVRVGTFFVVALLVSLLFLGGVAWVLMRVLRWFVRSALWPLPATLRHGVANLYRPGNHAEAILVSLGIGVMFTLTIFLVQRSLLVQLVQSAPPDMPNVFLINITPQERDGMLELLHAQSGIQGKVDLVPAVSARLVSVNGTPIGEIQIQGWRARFRRELTVTWREQVPEATRVVGGEWWDASQPPEDPLLSVGEEAATLLRIQPGAELAWNAAGRTFTAKVAAIHRTETVRAGSNIDFIFSPGALEGMPVLYFGSLRVNPASVPPLQRASFRQFPSVTVINIADVLEIVQGVVDQVGLVIRFVSVFAILGGVIILASSVAGTRFRRIREVVIFKTLGATRYRLGAMFSVEFLILGAVAGLMGSLLASGFASLLLKRLFDADFRFDVLPNLACIVLSALLANAAGWLASFRILGQKPLEVLREE
jgi:putative ABC transport system permease protein